MPGLKAVIIDDEPDSIAILQLQLERHCKNIETIITFNNPEKALLDIPVITPDIIFLDVEMPIMNGFEMLERLAPLEYNIIFITAYSQYAVRAFKFNALDYLLKPVNNEDLQLAITKIETGQKQLRRQFTQASQNFGGAEITSVAFSSLNGVTFLSLEDIVYVEASNNYCRISQTDGATHIVSKTLKDVQLVLEDSHFMRVHRQYLVNLNRVKHFNKNDGILTMDTKKEIPIVRNQFERFMKNYSKL
ncbi:MAG: LytR/AlgR family response regulator transcription factor [Flavipsychrobacter sp.]